ncbi:hypothetical protein [Saccharothrix lopnurensis]|uniref:Uncharacterized protein n=1 Tax=Saccharothrix lopnurensis TaxID=1670621 RepID=A0ABW1P7Y2_9PSEU
MTQNNGVTPSPEGGSPALRSSEDISAEVALAHRRAAEWDGVRGELMATYAEWGDLLERWNRGAYPGSDEEFEAECRDYLEQSVVLGEACDRDGLEQLAVLMARAAAGYRAEDRAEGQGDEQDEGVGD